ncbi:hypothetical protein D3C85_1093960 [compost metagenome]
MRLKSSMSMYRSAAALSCPRALEHTRSRAACRPARLARPVSTSSLARRSLSRSACMVDTRMRLSRCDAMLMLIR